MAKPKTTGKVIQRSDQWIEAGVITIVVSGVLTISMRAYFEGKVPFWSEWPGILGFAIILVGLIFVVVGVALREDGNGTGQGDSNRDSNNSAQRQTAATGDSAQRPHDL
jgi:hypothetical protein